MLQQLRPVNGSGGGGSGQEAFNFVCNGYEVSSEARVHMVFAEMQSCTLPLRGDHDVYFAGLYRLRLQPQHVGCVVDDYQLQANALSGLSAEHILMLGKLRTLQDLTMVNKLLREVYVNDILPKKDKKRLRGYLSEAAMTTTTTANRWGKNRDMSEVVCHNCKARDHCANKCPAMKHLLGGTTTSGAPCTRRGHIQAMSTWLIRQLLNQLPLFLHCSDYIPCHRDMLIYVHGKLVVFVHLEGRATTNGRQQLCGVGWYVWRPGGGVGGEEQVA